MGKKSKTTKTKNKKTGKNDQNALDDFELDLGEPEGDDDSSTETELSGKEEEEVKIEIKRHHFSKGVCWMTVRFPDEQEDDNIEHWWIWYEFKEQMRAYIKKKNRKGLTWEEPSKQMSTKIVAVLGHKKQNKQMQLHVLWNTGWDTWAPASNVMADKGAFLEADMVENYWEDVKKKRKKKS